MQFSSILYNYGELNGIIVEIIRNCSSIWGTSTRLTIEKLIDWGSAIRFDYDIRNALNKGSNDLEVITNGVGKVIQEVLTLKKHVNVIHNDMKVLKADLNSLITSFHSFTTSITETLQHLEQNKFSSPTSSSKKRKENIASSTDLITTSTLLEVTTSNEVTEMDVPLINYEVTTLTTISQFIKDYYTHGLQSDMNWKSTIRGTKERRMKEKSESFIKIFEREYMTKVDKEFLQTKAPPTSNAFLYNQYTSRLSEISNHVTTTVMNTLTKYETEVCQKGFNNNVYIVSVYDRYLKYESYMRSQPVLGRSSIDSFVVKK